jgi:hypothetical protein
LSWLLEAPAGLGVVTTAHVVPFQVSARVTDPEAPVDEPTAMHVCDDAHATPFSWLLVAPAGLGVATMDHVVPFQASARVVVAPRFVVDEPTAMQFVLVTQEMPLSWL